MTSIGTYAFRGCDNLTAVYYKGSADDWSNISIPDDGIGITEDIIYYYSETEPTDTINQYWHYVDGVPTVWEIGTQVPSLPTPNLDGAVTGSSSPIAYSWSELKALAQANLSADELRDTYGIEVGDYKEVDGVKYVLADLDGNDYDGFVFMYKAGKTKVMNSTSTNAGGYVSTDVMKPYVDGLYDGLATDLKSAIKKVTITCNSGDLNADGTDDNGMSTYTTDAYLFLASSKEVGFTISGYQYAAEGAKFDLFVDQTARANFATLANISSNWWLRSAESDGTKFFCTVTAKGNNNGYNPSYSCAVVPAFVIG